MRAVKNGLPFRVGRSPLGGLGLFATENIKKGVRIVEYTGKRVRTTIADEHPNRYLFDMENGWTIDGSGRTNVARYINHSCKPNAESILRKRKIYIRATKRIRAGEEITYDYGEEYFDEYFKDGSCMCHSCIAKRAK